MKIQIITPRKSLGCLGFRFGRLYFDFFLEPYIGMFYSHCNHRGRVGITRRDVFFTFKKYITPTFHPFLVTDRELLIRLKISFQFSKYFIQPRRLQLFYRKYND